MNKPKLETDLLLRWRVGETGSIEERKQRDTLLCAHCYISSSTLSLIRGGYQGLNANTINAINNFLTQYPLGIRLPPYPPS